MNIAICDDDRVIIEQIEEFLQIIHDKSFFVRKNYRNT